MKIKKYEDFLQNFHYKSFPVDISSIIKSKWITLDSLNTDELDWLCVKINGNWHIFCKHNICPERKRFTLAHEFKHFLEKENACAIQWQMRTNMEREANVFAWKLLVPRKKLIETWGKYNNIDILKKIFWVSTQVIKKRLKDEWIK